MPLTELCKMFPGFDSTNEELVVDHPCWIYVWECEGWMSDSPDEVVSLVLVYRSPLVKDTSTMYGHVARRILEEDHMDVLAQGSLDDENMMYGAGEYLLMRFCPVSYNPDEYPLEAIRERLYDDMNQSSARRKRAS